LCDSASFQAKYMRSTGVAPDASSWLFDNLSFMASLLAKG
jgi:hypothetical protein